MFFTTETSLLAAIIIYHEGPDISLELSIINLLNAAKATLDTASTALRLGHDNCAGDISALQLAIETTTQAYGREQHRSLITSNLDTNVAARAYIDITGCQQLNPIKSQNIAKYFNMLIVETEDVPDNMHYYAQYWERFNTRISKNPIFAQRVQRSEWVAYHVNAYQNGPLVIRANMSIPVPEVGKSYFSSTELTSARSHESARDSMALAREIPKSALVKVYAILDANYYLPTSKWYMVWKAMKSYLVSQYSLLVKAIKACSKAKNN